MSRSGDPYDNPLAESFMRTLKYEEVYLKTYRDLDDVPDRFVQSRERSCMIRLPSVDAVESNDFKLG